MDKEKWAHLTERMAELESEVESMGGALTDTQAHVVAAEVILIATVAQARIDRAAIIAIFQTTRASVPPAIAARAEEILLGLLEIEAPRTTGFH